MPSGTSSSPNATSNLNPRHSVESIIATIATIESLTETLPAVLTVANGWAPANVSFRNRDTLISAADMLRAYRSQRQELDHVSDMRMTCEALDNIFNEGHRIGVTVGEELEKGRAAAETRKPRKAKAAK